jgi:Predicted xylanase/chitin deacetylase
MKAIVVLLSIVLFCQGIPAYSYDWPKGKKCAVVLTYDDGLESQIRYAIPQLNRKKMRGTFFLYAQNIRIQDIPVWRKASKKGHELGNHSIYHPCISLEKPAGGVSHALNDYTLDDIETELKIMSCFLSAIDGKDHPSYAYPCGQNIVDGVNYGEYLIRKGVIEYGRSGTMDEFVSNPDSLDFSMVPTIVATEGIDAQALVDRVERICEEGGLGVFLFHGVGGDYLSIDAHEHLSFLEYLSKHSSEIWVAPFSEVLDYVKANIKD